MLLEFKVSNYKTFTDETIFSMIPAPKIKDLRYSVLQQSVTGKQYKALSSAVIYGPNAAGKTNIISAMEVLKSIVLSGNIRNDNSTLPSPNEALRRLELIPSIQNAQNNNSTPVKFGIKFVESGLLFNYELHIDIGNFLEKDYDRRIYVERLSVNNKVIFDRNDGIIIGDLSVIKHLLISDFNRNASEKMAKSNLEPKELFLCGMFKSVFSKELTNIILNWFRTKFICIYQSNMMSVGIPLRSKKSIQITGINETVSQAVRHFGINSNNIVYIANKDAAEAELHSIVQDSNKNAISIPISIFESYGTVRFLNIFPLVLQALDIGATLVIDEFDASIHPMAIMSIIGAFHNDEINKNNAQLIFNTHNPIFLNKNLFRRDEIKFIDRDDDTGCSSHYSLSDFKTSGPYGVRNTSDYMKNYFINQYGSIRNVDFSDILRSNMPDVVTVAEV